MKSTPNLFDRFTDLGKQGFIYGMGTFVQRLAAFILLPLYTTTFTTQEYGSLGLVLISGQVAGVLFSLGLRSSLFRSYFDYEDELAQKRVITTVFIITGFSSVVLVIVTICCSALLSDVLLGHPNSTLLIMLISGYTVFDLYIQLTLAVLRARKESLRFVLIQISMFLLKVGLIVFQVLYLKKDLQGVLEAYFLVGGISCVFLFWIIRDAFVFQFSKLEAIKMLRYGGPLVFVGLFGFVSTYIDRYILNYFNDLHIVGLYTLAYQISLLMVVLLITPFKLVWGPIYLSAKEDNDFKEFCATSLTYLLIIGGFFFLGIALCSKELLQIMCAPEYEEAYKIIPLLAFTYLIWSTRSIIEVGIHLRRKTGMIALFSFSGAILNGIFNLLFIPRFGMEGAALATFISFSFSILIEGIYSRKLFHIHYEWDRLFKVGILIGFLFMIGYYVSVQNVILSLLMKGCLIISFPLLLFPLKFFRKNELFRIQQVLATHVRVHD